ncbi:MAG: ParB/RepB/Spo0J family partition protein [Patescibacteria group bacterium]|nr:ParB/RepB/Spo0J family partition protein [Patescibacteria group bacterium]
MGSKQVALGKGLSALISSNNVPIKTKGYIPNLPIDQISPNPYQPRMAITPDDLIELSDSIRETGLLQPVIVTKRGEKDYVLIIGERRWRATQLAGVETIPVVIRDASPQQMLELAVIENIQRKDLNPIEEALAFKQLREQYSITPAKIGSKVGLSRVAVVNKIRLLKLPEQVKQLVVDKKLTEGHARALLGIVDHESIVVAADVVIRKKLSVHGTEDLVRRIMKGAKQPGGRPRRLNRKALKIESNLKRYFPGTSVSIVKLKSGGKITIRYKGEKGLDKVYRLITRIR